MKQRRWTRGVLERDPIRKDWYFEGFERRVVPGSGGKDKKVFVYTGVYYGFGLPARTLARLKAAYGVLAALFLVVYLAISLLPFRANHENYVALPLIWTLAPGIYLFMGIFCLLAAGERMTARVFYGSVRRIRRALRFALPLSALTLAADIVFLVRSRAAADLPRELCFTAGAALAFAALLGIKGLQRRYPALPQQGPAVS